MLARGFSPPSLRAGKEPGKNGFSSWKGGWMDGWMKGGLGRGTAGFLQRRCSARACCETGPKPSQRSGGGGRKREHMCAMHLFGATQPANHPPHHSVPGETLLRNNLCYSRERGLCFCATWRKHEMVFPLRTSACVNQLGEDPKPLTLADSDQSRLSPPLTSPLFHSEIN